MPLSTAEAMSAYGFVYSLASAVPDLKDLLDQAIQAKWTPENFKARVESTNWWKANGDAARNLVISRAADPATYRQNLAAATDSIILKAQQMGRGLSLATAQKLALRTLSENGQWDDNRLSELVANTAVLSHGEGGSYKGQAANLFDHMTTVAQNYGVGYTSGWLETWVNEIESGRNTLDGWESVMRSRAKAAYPQFANQLDSGMTVRDIADPYISTYAQTLEVPETQVTLKDNYIKKALSQTGQDGTTQTSMPLWQFQRLLKDDPRYDRTQQAKTDAFTTLNKIGKDWGFVGASA